MRNLLLSIALGFTLLTAASAQCSECCQYQYQQQYQQQGYYQNMTDEYSPQMDMDFNEMDFNDADMEQYAQMLLLMMNSQNQFQSNTNFTAETNWSQPGYDSNTNYSTDTDWNNPGMQAPNTSQMPLRHTKEGGAGDFKSEGQSEAFGDHVHLRR
jgi:hypothetical protein